MSELPEAATYEALLRSRALTRAQRDAGRKPPTFESVVISEPLGPVSVTADIDKVQGFAFATDDFGSWHFQDSPFGGPVGHAALLANDLLTVYYTNFDRHRVDTPRVHVSEELEFISPVGLGERAEISGSYVEKYRRNQRDHVVMDAVATGEDGRVLIRHRSVDIIVDPDARGASSREKSIGTDSDRVSGDFRADLPAVAVASLELSAGTPLIPLHVAMTSEKMAVFSFVGELEKNIHNDLGMAKLGGFSRPICQGQHQVCLASRLMTRFFGEAWYTTGRLKSKFINPLYGETAVTVGGVVRAWEDTPAGSRLHADFWVEHGGKFMTVGWASAIVPTKEHKEVSGNDARS